MRKQTWALALALPTSSVTLAKSVYLPGCLRNDEGQVRTQFSPKRLCPGYDFVKVHMITPPWVNK